jgi:hypothetical protein
MTEIPADKLEKGVRYRIDHRRGLLASDVGVFEVLLGTPPNVNARFTNVRGPNNFRSPSLAYRVDEWTFRKSGQTIAAEKGAEAIGLPPDGDPNDYDHALPDELEREVKKYLGGRRRKTRKSKRRSRKTRRRYT